MAPEQTVELTLRDTGGLAFDIELSDTRYCPAHAMLGGAAEIRSEYEVHKSEWA